MREARKKNSHFRCVASIKTRWTHNIRFSLSVDLDIECAVIGHVVSYESRCCPKCSRMLAERCCFSLVIPEHTNRLADTYNVFPRSFRLFVSLFPYALAIFSLIECVFFSISLLHALAYTMLVMRLHKRSRRYAFSLQRYYFHLYAISLWSVLRVFSSLFVSRVCECVCERSTNIRTYECWKHAYMSISEA